MKARILKTATLTLAGVAVAFGIGVGPAVAQSGAQTPMFEHVGTVEWVDLSQQAVVVDDRQFQLSAGTKVRTADQRTARASDLRPGMKIGFKFSQSSTPWVLTDVWLLPAGYTPAR